MKVKSLGLTRSFENTKSSCRNQVPT